LKFFTTSIDPTLTSTTSTIKEEEDINEGPIFYRGILNIEGDAAELVADAAGQLHMSDTFLDTHKLGKGVAWVNGFNLGWYWPTMGPQMTLYVPGPVLKPGENDILILEVEKVTNGDAEKTVNGRFWFVNYNYLLLCLWDFK
jgi:beta-galactosidase